VGSTSETNLVYIIPNVNTGCALVRVKKCLEIDSNADVSTGIGWLKKCPNSAENCVLYLVSLNLRAKKEAHWNAPLCRDDRMAVR
jgi:hypothetical protein